jgi:tRNA (Thr-GGU) A37 N-methylase
MKGVRDALPGPPQPARLLIDEKGWIEIAALEAIDGTPIVDVKPVLDVNGGS